MGFRLQSVGFFFFVIITLQSQKTLIVGFNLSPARIGFDQDIFETTFSQFLFDCVLIQKTYRWKLCLSSWLSVYDDSKKIRYVGFNLLTTSESMLPSIVAFQVASGCLSGS